MTELYAYCIDRAKDIILEAESEENNWHRLVGSPWEKLPFYVCQGIAECVHGFPIAYGDDGSYFYRVNIIMAKDPNENGINIYTELTRIQHGFESAQIAEDIWNEHTKCWVAYPRANAHCFDEYGGIELPPDEEKLRALGGKYQLDDFDESKPLFDYK